MPASMDSADNTPVGNPYDRDFGGAITMVMAGSLLVFLRRNIGLRLLIRRRFVVVAALLIGWCYVETPFDRSLAMFAAAFVVLAFLHYQRHMSRIRSGVPEWHTFDTGQSLIFSLLPLPRSLTQIIIEPLLCGALGWWFVQRSNATFYLGWWIVFASISLFFLENRIRIARRESLFDLGDTFVESANFARRAEQFASAPSGSGSATRQQNQNNSWGVFLWRILATARFAYEEKQAREEAEARRRQQDNERRQEEEAARTRQRQKGEQSRQEEQRREAPSSKMTVAQALEILELKDGATEQEIRAAYNRLIQRVHPDVGGSTFFAKQLNAARDVLLKRPKH